MHIYVGREQPMHLFIIQAFDDFICSPTKIKDRPHKFIFWMNILSFWLNTYNNFAMWGSCKSLIFPIIKRLKDEMILFSRYSFVRYLTLFSTNNVRTYSIFCSHVFVVLHFILLCLYSKMPYTICLFMYKPLATNLS